MAESNRTGTADGDVVDERGVLITAAGRRRARELLDTLDARRSPAEAAEAGARLVEQLRRAA